MRDWTYAAIVYVPQRERYVAEIDLTRYTVQIFSFVAFVGVVQFVRQNRGVQ